MEIISIPFLPVIQWPLEKRHDQILMISSVLPLSLPVMHASLPTARSGPCIVPYLLLWITYSFLCPERATICVHLVNFWPLVIDGAWMSPFCPPMALCASLCCRITTLYHMGPFLSSLTMDFRHLSSCLFTCVLRHRTRSATITYLISAPTSL